MANILLAEDDHSMRQFLAAALEKAGHTVTACGDGLTAMKAIEAEAAHFDLLLADIVMPGIDGIELSYRARRHIEGLKVLFITGFSGASGGDSATPVLSKPFHLSQLIRQVNDILGL